MHAEQISYGCGMQAMVCSACAKPVNAAAATCPHCGVRQATASVGLAGKTVSHDEMAALLLFDGRDIAPSQGVLATLILPHPHTRGVGRVVELVCTVIALPLVTVGAFTLALKNRRHRAAADATTGELAPVLAMTGLGGLGFYGVLSLAGLPPATILSVLGASVSALIIRGMVRARVATSRSRRLLRVDKPASPTSTLSRPAAARSVSATVVAQAPKTHAPNKVAPREPGEEPSLLT